MKETDDHSILAFILLLIFIVPMALLFGVILRDLWAWFITPVFGGPAISALQAVGIGIVATFFRHGLKRAEPDTDNALDKAVAEIIASVIFGLVVWAYGALWHTFT